MNKLSNLLESLINAFTRVHGMDIFIEPMSLSRGPLSFSYEKTGADREWWGLGLHVVASPLRMSPQ